MTLPGRTARPRRHWLVFLGLAVVIVVLDQLSKAWVVANVPADGAIEVLGNWLRLIITQNTGALFGLFRDNAAQFALVSILVVGAIVLVHARSAPSLALSIALGLLLGGAVGNFVDRIRLGYVVDFVDMGIGDWRFYTYNIADAAITTAIIALLVLAVWPGVGEAIDRLGAPEATPDERAADG